MSKKMHEHPQPAATPGQPAGEAPQEAELPRADNELERLFDLVPDMMSIASTDGYFRKINRAWQATLGYTEQELLATPFIDLVHPDDREATLREVERQQAGQTITQFVNRYRCKDGSYKWLEWVATPCFDNKRLYASARDITRQRQAEAMLRANEAHLREIIDMIPVALFVKDPDSRITLMNRVCEEQWGMSFSELRGTDASQFFPPDQMALFLARDREVFANRKLVDFEETVWRAALKENRIMHTYKKPVFDEAGRPLYLIGVSVDITERKRVEEMMRRHKLVIDTAMDGFWMIDMAGNLLEANKAYAEMSGYTVGELLTMHISQLDVGEKSTEDVAAHSKKVIAQGYDRFEARHRRKDGQEIDVEVFARFMPETQTFFSFLRDITERKRAERDLRELNEQLEARVAQRTHELVQAKQLAESANRIKSEFLANVSHEIRTPLNSILGMAHLALSIKGERRNQDYLKKIHASGEHLLGIIDDILDFSRLDAGKLKIDMVDFDLCRMLENVRNLVAGKAAAKGLELAFAMDDDLCLNLHGDPLRLAQILVNYADNAVKFTEQGRVDIRARRIEESETSCLVRFEVQDTGIGIGAAERAGLFEPFRQVDASPARQYEGTGLGLAICKQLAEMMPDGAVGVDSVPGQGSTFWLRVRLDKTGQPCHTEKRSLPEVPPGILAALDGAHVLLVENNLFNQQVATEFLENAGAVVNVAQNGKEALDLLANGRFDCVLMDIQMPMLDGFETTRLIRANPALAKIPVIAMTANVSDDYREYCRAAGMDDFISKPFKPHAFYAVIARWLEGAGEPPVPETPAAAADRVARAGDPIDLSLLAELVGGDRRKMREFAHKFLASARQDMADVEAALQRKDVAALGALGHHIKSPARMAGATGFADLCQALEDHGKSGADLGQIQGVVGRMRALLERIGEQIGREFG
jgi:PAS domain S-box-containing protein